MLTLCTVAQDATLRRSKKKCKWHEIPWKYWDSSDGARIAESVLDITKQTSKNMIEETGVQPTLSEDEMKQYLQEVLQEVKASRTW